MIEGFWLLNEMNVTIDQLVGKLSQGRSSEKILRLSSPDTSSYCAEHSIVQVPFVKHCLLVAVTHGPIAVLCPFRTNKPLPEQKE